MVLSTTSLTLVAVLASVSAVVITLRHLRSPWPNMPSISKKYRYRRRPPLAWWSVMTLRGMAVSLVSVLVIRSLDVRVDQWPVFESVFIGSAIPSLLHIVRWRCDGFPREPSSPGEQLSQVNRWVAVEGPLHAHKMRLRSEALCIGAIVNLVVVLTLLILGIEFLVRAIEHGGGIGLSLRVAVLSLVEVLAAVLYSIWRGWQLTEPVMKEGVQTWPVFTANDHGLVSPHDATERLNQ